MRAVFALPAMDITVVRKEEDVCVVQQIQISEALNQTPEIPIQVLLLSHHRRQESISDIADTSLT